MKEQLTFLPLNCLSLFAHLPDSIGYSADGTLVITEQEQKQYKLSEYSHENQKKYPYKRLRYGKTLLIVHRIIAQLFIENTRIGYANEVNHIDCNTRNNCINNLEWVTRKENCNRKKIHISCA